jgi:hypothetical protein
LLIKRGVVVATSYQHVGDALCSECEQLLHKRGEDWVLPRLARRDMAFPLMEIVRQRPPQSAVPSGSADPACKVYCGADNAKLDMDALTHFAAGVLWKSTLDCWMGRNRPRQNEIGPTAEALRLYLLGLCPFPADTLLQMWVLPGPFIPSGTCVPYRGVRATFDALLFYVPGIWFVLGLPPIGTETLGSSMTGQCRPFLVSDISTSVMLSGGTMLANAKAAMKNRRLASRRRLRRRGVAPPSPSA